MCVVFLLCAAFRWLDSTVEDYERPSNDFVYPGKKATWERGSEGNIGHTYGLCWYFARQLYDVLEIPIGFIGAAVSGSPIAEWMSKEAYGKCPIIALPEQES